MSGLTVDGTEIPREIEHEGGDTIAKYLKDPDATLAKVRKIQEKRRKDAEKAAAEEAVAETVTEGDAKGAEPTDSKEE